MILTCDPTDEVAAVLGQLESLQAFTPVLDLSRLNAEDQQRVAMLSRKAEQLAVSIRIGTVIEARQYQYVWEICATVDADWLKEKNFGRKSLQELKQVLADMGLELGMKERIQAWRYLLPSRNS
jgi:DNA-directed RNA polymerase alpha subunit